MFCGEIYTHRMKAEALVWTWQSVGVAVEVVDSCSSLFLLISLKFAHVSFFHRFPFLFVLFRLIYSLDVGVSLLTRVLENFTNLIVVTSQIKKMSNVSDKWSSTCVMCTEPCQSEKWCGYFMFLGIPTNLPYLAQLCDRGTCVKPKLMKWFAPFPSLRSTLSWSSLYVPVVTNYPHICFGFSHDETTIQRQLNVWSRNICTLIRVCPLPSLSSNSLPGQTHMPSILSFYREILYSSTCIHFRS